jgi:hypothetical protein
MKKNVGYPIKFIRQQSARSNELDRLAALSTIPDSDKQSQLQQIADAISSLQSEYRNKQIAVENEYIEKSRELPEEDFTAEKTGKLAVLFNEHADAVGALRQQQIQVNLIVTNEEKAQQIADIRFDLEAAARSVGLQDMSIEDIAQQTKDEFEESERKRIFGYRTDRLKKYPPIREQLDAIMKGGEDLEAMRTRVMAVKEEFPKPDLPPSDPDQPGDPRLPRDNG